MEPTAQRAVRLTGRSTEAAKMEITTRSNLACDGNSDPTQGVSCMLVGAAITNNLRFYHWGGSSSSLNRDFQYLAGDVYFFEMIDDGTDITCTFTNERTGITHSISGTTGAVTASHYVRVSLPAGKTFVRARFCRGFIFFVSCWRWVEGWEDARRGVAWCVLLGCLGFALNVRFLVLVWNFGWR